MRPGIGAPSRTRRLSVNWGLDPPKLVIFWSKTIHLCGWALWPIPKYLQSQWLHKKKASDGFSGWLEDKNCACKLDFRRVPFSTESLLSTNSNFQRFNPADCLPSYIQKSLVGRSFHLWAGWLTPKCFAPEYRLSIYWFEVFASNLSESDFSASKTGDPQDHNSYGFYKPSPNGPNGPSGRSIMAAVASCHRCWTRSWQARPVVPQQVCASSWGPWCLGRKPWENHWIFGTRLLEKTNPWKKGHLEESMPRDHWIV